MKIKVVLVICPQVNPDRPPLSLAYLTTYLAKRNIEVVCFDFNIDLYFRVDDKKKNLWDSQCDIDWLDENRYNSINLVNESIIREWVGQICQTSPQIIGFSLLSTNVYSTLRLAKEIKAKNNGARIIFGGPETYRLFGLGNYGIFDYADALVLGEGEESLYKIISYISNDKKIEPAEGIVVKENDILLGYDRFNLISNIDEMPFPDYDVFPLYKYKEKGQLPLIFSRGCIGRCAFCFERVYWKRFRCRSVDNVIEEIELMKRKYNIWCFSLNDSLMNGNIRFLSEFCDRVISEGIQVGWWGMARIDSRMTEEFLIKMVKAGCKQIAYGIESGSQKVLNLMHKDYDVSTIDRILLNTYRAGIKPGINLMLGFPGEEEEDFQQTCELVKRNGQYVSYVNISILGIEPFTDVYENRIKMNIDFKDATNWKTRDRKNTYQIRIERAKRLAEVVNKYVEKVFNFANT